MVSDREMIFFSLREACAMYVTLVISSGHGILDFSLAKAKIWFA